jgi:hypothetical protein
LDKSSPVAKARNHNIRVSPAVLDAAGGDSAALLQSLHTTPMARALATICSVLLTYQSCFPPIIRWLS